MSESPKQFTNAALAFAEQNAHTGMPVALYAVRDDGVRPVLHTYQPVVFAEPPEWAPFLPIPGTYHHPIYGQLDYTPDYYETLMANFKTGVYQDRLPVNAEHDQHSSGAVGWITDMRLAESGAIEVKVEWNERGRSLIEADRYKYVSAEVYPGWADPIDPDQTYDVAIGMAICTQPYFKQSVLPPLVASEAVLSRTAGNPGKENAAMAEETQATVPETPATGTPTDVQQATDQIIAQLSEKLDGKKISDPAVNEFVERAARELAQARANELKATENATKLSEQNAVLRAQNRVKYFTDEVTGRSDSNGTPWVGDVSDHVKMACSLTEKFGENSWELQHYIRSNRSNAEQARMSSLFTDIGSGKPADGGLTAYDQISMLATERAKASGETFAVAFDATLMSEHDLRAKYARESRQG